jgi:hypothetical protein
MDIHQAKGILSALADGINPLTGELLSSDCVCNQVEVVRALHCILNALSRVGDKEVPPNAGKPWTEHEDELLLNAYLERKSISEMAKAHGRTIGAINSRLNRIVDEVIEIDSLAEEESIEQ